MNLEQAIILIGELTDIRENQSLADCDHCLEDATIIIGDYEYNCKDCVIETAKESLWTRHKKTERVILSTM